MRDSFIDFGPPDLGDEEARQVADTLRSGWLTTGPRTAEFEEAFAAYVGAEAALGLNSGTAAIHCAIAAHGIREGDVVLVPTMTFSSAAHTVEHVGARPVFVDAEPETLNPDAHAIEKAMSDRAVRCIVPVHLYGQPCDEHIFDLGPRIVDDAAHALPAKLGGSCIGGSRRADVLTAFSFYATKNLTTGEGGMLTGPRELIDEARAWSLHGMTKDARHRYEAGGSWRYDVTRAGFKYNMSDINAAIGIVQLRRLPEMYERRKQIAARYEANLERVDEVQRPQVRAGTEHAWHIYAIRLHLDRLTIGRDRFIDELTHRNVGTSVHFIPIHLLSYYRDKYGLRPEDFPVATREFERLISLPIYPSMTDADVDDVVEAVADVCAKHRR
jgi:dTDP-4-amino-4,6-dideoxygalactose transaminase